MEARVFEKLKRTPQIAFAIDNSFISAPTRRLFISSVLKAEL